MCAPAVEWFREALAGVVKHRPYGWQVGARLVRARGGVVP